MKVDVKNLKPGFTYYYDFEALGSKSIIGRTRTAPSGSVDLLRFAVVSCSNYQQGYFNAYRDIARQDDLDAVIHLGDYIYESGAPGYGYADSVGRGHVPHYEIIDLFDYRTRYSHYRLDPDLRRVHQMHPFICIWDDHESTNDSYKDGAQNHQPNEGDWEERKSVSKQAYFEWLPIREQGDRIYRTLKYGDLADLIMIDSRLEGREKQLRDSEHPELNDPDRTILGSVQLEWLKSELSNSKAKWKVIGNQVLFSPIYATQVSKDLQDAFTDTWAGYPAERYKLMQHIVKSKIDNVVVITGDFHTSFAFDIPASDRLYPPAGGASGYNGVGIGVEFATPSITSANFDEAFVSGGRAQNLQQARFAIGLARQALLSSTFEGETQPANAHLKYAELTEHGYFILSLTPEFAQADYRFIDTYTRISDGIKPAASLRTQAGVAKLSESQALAPSRRFWQPALRKGVVENDSGPVIMSFLPLEGNRAKVHLSIKEDGEISIRDSNQNLLYPSQKLTKGDYVVILESLPTAFEGRILVDFKKD